MTENSQPVRFVNEKRVDQSESCYACVPANSCARVPNKGDCDCLDFFDREMKLQIFKSGDLLRQQNLSRNCFFFKTRKIYMLGTLVLGQILSNFYRLKECLSKAAYNLNERNGYEIRNTDQKIKS